MADLNKLRIKIEEIDRKMVELFEQRMQVVEHVLVCKKEQNLPIIDTKREEILLSNNATHLVDKSLLRYYQDFLKNIIGISKEYQITLLGQDMIGYQGIAGSFGNAVARERFNDCYLKSYDTFNEVVEELLQNKIKYGVLPFENSYAGDVNGILDILFYSDVFITDIYYLDIKQNLLGIKGSILSEIETVYSHPQAINQCLEFIKQKKYQILLALNTAIAAKAVSQKNDKTIAAIASLEAAKLYDLEVLKKDIQTNKENQTKFIILAKQISRSGNRISIMFSVKQGSGQLAIILNEIASHNFDMECIKSRATKNIPWQYYFYVELVGN